MSNRDTRSQSVKNEVKTEILDHVIKEEIKTEIEEITRKSNGFICPTCESYFLYEDNFIEHIRQIHSDTSITSGEQIYYNEPLRSSESQVIENLKKAPQGCDCYHFIRCSRIKYKDIVMSYTISLYSMFVSICALSETSVSLFK